MKRYNITVPKKYNKNGEEKTSWNTVGTLVHFPPQNGKTEGFILELNMFPHTTFKVFEQKPKENKVPDEFRGYEPQGEEVIDLSAI